MRASFFLNHDCNLRCRYCYNGEKFSQRMTWEVARKGLDFAFSSHRKKVQVSFFGGEPLLETALLERIVDYAEKRAGQEGKIVRFVLTTNGTLLNPARLNYLMKHGFHMGVSLDGDKRAHDANRLYVSGRSCHARVSRSIGKAVKLYPALEVIAVLDPSNASLAGESFRYFMDLGVRDVTFNLNYEADWDDDACAALEKGFQDLADEYVKKVREGVFFTCNPIDAKIVTRLKEGYCATDRCDFGCNEIAISPRGNFYPCERLVGVDDRGDVMIGDVWNGLDFAKRDALREAKNGSHPECDGCSLSERCMYWCGCVNHALTGRVDSIDGTLCWAERLFINTADRAAGILYREKNALFIERYYISAGGKLNAP